MEHFTPYQYINACNRNDSGKWLDPHRTLVCNYPRCFNFICILTKPPLKLWLGYQKRPIENFDVITCPWAKFSLSNSDLPVLVITFQGLAWWSLGDALFVTWGGLTHWGRVTHICVSRLTIIGSDNGLSPGRRQAMIWTNAKILLTGPLGTNFSDVLIEILTFSFTKVHFKVSSA